MLLCAEFSMAKEFNERCDNLNPENLGSQLSALGMNFFVGK